MLPCYASTSPFSPQLSSLGTPRLGPSIKVQDPYNVLAPPLPPPLPPPPVFSRSFLSNMMDEDKIWVVMEVFLISHGECQLSLRTDLVGGRRPEAVLIANGKCQARVLAMFLNSQGIRFNVVYSSPLDRARSVAISVCQVWHWIYLFIYVWKNVQFGTLYLGHSLDQLLVIFLRVK